MNRSLLSFLFCAISIGIWCTSCSDSKSNPDEEPDPNPGTEKPDPSEPVDGTLRVLYWNIQNGMWAGQPDNYNKFVEFVQQQNPDVCVWCEAASIYKTGTAESQAQNLRYLPENWGELAARYGHKYWFIGGWRDNYPQVITSKYRIRTVAQIKGATPDSVVSHGAGWAQIERNGNTINIVTLHTWPQSYKFGLPNDDAIRKASSANNEGEKYRRMEIEYVCKHTIGTTTGASKQLWLMMGDFNSRSKVDNFFYKYAETASAFWVHNYISENTPYIDIIARKYPGVFKTSTGGNSRIDFMYCTLPMYNCITYADILKNSYLEPVRDPNGLSNFYLPSDHRPILVEFDLNKLPKKQ